MTSLLDVPPEKNRAASSIAIFGTVVAHGVVVLLISFAGVRGVSELKKLLPVTEMVEVDLPEPAAPAHVAPAEPQPAPAHFAPPKSSPAELPPTAAQAGQVLDAKSDVVDFGDSFVTGGGNEFAGGVTDSRGTSMAAVRDSTAQGNGAGEAKAPVVAAVDHSRAPQLADGARWQCPFPVEADDAGIDHTVVTLQVDVAADGSVRAVSLLSDPGNGFGREARRCANSKRWQSGMDRLGNAVDARATVNVHFDR